jgi:hypothetical protein
MNGQVKTMFDIQKEYLELMETIMENEGFMTEEQEEALKINQENILVKTDKYGFMVERMNVEKKMVAEKIKQLQSYKKVLDNTEKKFKENILNAMNVYELDKIESDNFKFSLRKSEVVNLEVEGWQLPQDCQVIEIKPISKTELKKMLKEGREIDGVSLQKNKSLTIKSK